ncbi:MAG TPA: hypothetical protein VGR65_02860 [Casimicrobiaceae bacterium]|jgi:hypothetical protein|nr:hypothetical protein [Casimicrobiaceae bacterium]
MALDPCFRRRATVTLPQLDSSSNWLQLFEGNFMQIATHNHDQPGPARFASASGACCALESMQGFRGLALGCPSVTAKA